MTFLNPALLFGAGAVAAPIIIHLYMNRRVKRVVWAAMRFLQASVQKNQKRMNLEDLLLLALRCAFLLVLALALARPIFGGGAVKGGGVETAVIALDNSYSMGQSDGGTSRLAQARQAAEKVIDGLPAGSSVAVLLFSDVVQAAIPEPTFDLNLARKIVREAPLSSRATSVQPVLTQALETLARRGAGGSSIYLITDGQASGWSAWEELRRALATPSVSTRLILAGAPEEHNLAVSELRSGGALVSTGTAAPFEVEVSNFGSAEARAVSVKLSLDGEDPSDEGALESIPPGTAKSLTLLARFRAPGYRTVTARLAPDNLPADDQRTLALRVLDDVRVLLVDGEPGLEPRDSETFYLRHALTPVPAAEREKYFLKTKTIAPAELSSAHLADYEAVVLANVADLAPAAVEALTAYLLRGGGLVIFPGGKTDAAFYNETLGHKLNLLPATLGGSVPHESGYTLQAKDYTHRIVSLWNDPGAGTLATAQFNRAFVLTPLPGTTAEAGEPSVVLRFADGAPAVMERAWGRGRVILFSSTADTAWNDLPLRPAFVPLMARTLGAILDRQDARLNLPVGGRFEYVCDPEWLDRDALISGPAESGQLRRIGLTGGVPLLQFDGTSQAGAYDVLVKTEPPVHLKFATQFNAAESNLAELTPAQLETLAATTQVAHWGETRTLDFRQAKDGRGREWWTELAALALVLAGAELVLSALWSASK